MDPMRLRQLLADPSITIEDIASELRSAPAAAVRAAFEGLRLDGVDASPGPEQPRLAALRRTLAAAATMLRDAKTVPSRPQQGSPSIAAPTRLRVQQARSANELAPGLVIGERYLLLAQLGEGGMGQVWKARDLLLERNRDPNPQVAIKLLSGDFAAHPDAVLALTSEASKAGQLAHPNIAIVKIFEEDRSRALVYIVMELLEGETLDQRLRRSDGHGLARTEAMPIIRGLASGLAYAHSRGIVHCDFKPGNAFITSQGVPKILDFGIARAIQAASVDSFDAGSLHGLTVLYASLEMLRSEEPHPADDVYALGLVAYEMLSGRRPFGGLSAEEALQRGLTPAPLRGLPRREWRAIARALALERAARWPDAGAFLKALEGINRLALGFAGLASVALVVAGYAGYRNYMDSQPSVPFSSLTPEQQREFRSDLDRGNEVLQFGLSHPDAPEGMREIYADALPYFAQAYQLHPRDPNALVALRRSLNFLDQHLKGAQPDTRREARAYLERIRDSYPDLAKFPPLISLIDHLP
jgi:serine/threonine protein kinase